MSNGKMNEGGVTPWTLRALTEGAGGLGALRARLGSFMSAFASFRRDSWANTLTGMGTSRDKTAFSLPFTEALLTPQMLEVLYHTDDIAARIVSAVPDEAFREPWQVVNVHLTDKAEQLRKQGVPFKARMDAIDKLAKATNAHEQASALEGDLKGFGSRAKQREAMTWGRLYGFGAIEVGADDGRPSWAPLDLDNVRDVEYLTVLDKRDLVPWRWYADPAAPMFGEVALYHVQPVGVYVGAPYGYSTTNQLRLVHESRLIKYGGELTSKRERLRNQGSDYSVLQKCFRALQLTHTNWQSSSALLADASQGVFKIKGLIDMIAQQPDTMTTRMSLVDQMRSTLRAIILDADGENFERTPTPFNGIPDMLDQTWSRLALAAKMPKKILMGQSTGGLNTEATGDSDLEWWYNSVASVQRDHILPNTERLLRIYATARGFQDPQNWTVKFAPLKMQSAKDRAAYQYSVAQRDQIYMQEGVLLPEEVALSRFGSGTWSEETTIDVDTRKVILGLRLEQEEEDARNPPAPPPLAPVKPSAPPEPRPPTPRTDGS